jgi:hypothetical protein
VCLAGDLFGVVAAGDQELGGVLDPEPNPFQQGRGEFADQGFDHGVEVGDLVVEFQEAPGQGFDAMRVAEPGSRSRPAP